MNSALQSLFEQQVPDEHWRPPGSYWVPEFQPRPVESADRSSEFRFHLSSVDQGSLADRAALVHSIAANYVLESPAVTEFLRTHPAVVTLLSEASNRLDAAFGLNRVKVIRLIDDGSGEVSVFGIVSWPESIDSGRQALSKFDSDWWLQNCNRAGGAVNFNIELI